MDENLKEKIKIAKDAVSGEDEPYRTEAFKIILSSLIGENRIKTSKKSKSKPKQSKMKRVSKTIPLVLEQKNDLEVLAKKCDLSLDSFSEVFTIKNNIIQIIKRPKILEKQKHLLFSLCILTAYKILYEVEWLSSEILKKALDESGVGDLGHISEAVNDTPLIAHRGTKKATEYKISGKGIDQAIAIIQKLSRDESLIEN